MKWKRLRVAVMCFILLAGYGCAPPAYRIHPEFEARRQDIRAPGLIPPDVKIYEFSAGGIRELRDDWCSEGEKNLMNALMEGFEKKTCEIEVFSLDEGIRDDMEDIQALYRAVSASIQMHTYGPHVFPEKKETFDYSIGSIKDVLQKLDADAMIFVYGLDEISTGGRKALMVAGIVAGAVTGVALMPRSGITAVSVALVDSSGTVLWYGAKGGAGACDLRNAESTTNLVQTLLADFPRIGP